MFTRPGAFTFVALLVLGLAASPGLAAEEPDLEALYQLKSDGSTAAVKPGGKGRFVITIQALGGSHVSPEAPLSVSLSGENLTFEKTSLGRSDLRPSPEKTAHPVPRFEVPFQAGMDPKAVATAKVVFFLCTKDLCARRQRTLTLPVTVVAAAP